MKFNFSQVMTGFKTVWDVCKAHKREIKTAVKWVTGTGAVVYGVTKAAKTVHDIEEAGEKKGEPLTFTEKAGIVVKNQYPAMIMTGIAVGTGISLDIDSAKVVKEIKAVKEENVSLIGQIAELGNAYNTVNAVKEAFGKKIADDNGEEVKEEVQNQAMRPIVQSSYNAVPLNNRAYVENRELIEKWNNIYLQTGDIDYKIQEYYLPWLGQSFLNCNHGITMADKSIRSLIDAETGKGYATLADICAALHARVPDGVIGDNLVFRYHYETFGLVPVEMNLDGVAVFELRFYSEPYFDRENKYYD